MFFELDNISYVVTRLHFKVNFYYYLLTYLLDKLCSILNIGHNMPHMTNIV